MGFMAEEDGRKFLYEGDITLKGLKVRTPRQRRFHLSSCWLEHAYCVFVLPLHKYHDFMLPQFIVKD